jgi:hypothetical protein
VIVCLFVVGYFCGHHECTGAKHMHLCCSVQFSVPVLFGSGLPHDFFRLHFQFQSCDNLNTVI